MLSLSGGLQMDVAVGIDAEVKFGRHVSGRAQFDYKERTFETCPCAEAIAGRWILN